MAATRTGVRAEGRAVDHRPVQLTIGLTLTPQGTVSGGLQEDVQGEEPQRVESSMQESVTSQVRPEVSPRVSAW